MKRKILGVMILLLLVKGFSEEKNHSKLSADIGWNIGLYKETTFSCVTQHLFSPKFILNLEFGNQDFFHQVNMSYASCRPESKQTKTALVYKDFNPLTGESYYTGCYSSLFFHRINASYECLYRVMSEFHGFSFLLGGNFQANAYLQFENYPSITGILSLGPSAKLDFALDDKNRFSFIFDTSALGYGIRPPYAGCDALLMKYAEEDFFKIFTLGDFLSFHNYQTVNLVMGYEHKINKLISWNSKIDFEYTRISVPVGKPLYYLSAALNTGIAIEF